MTKTSLSRMLQRGFTLVEMMVIAPVVILLIGGFIALIVNLTGEVMSSRGSSVLAYDVQDALNRIEQDVKLSTTFLAVNNVDISTTKQGYGGTTTSGSTANFTNIDKTSSGGSTPSLILNSLVTDGNPISEQTGLVYLADKPNSCANYDEYTKNTPMTMNIVYFVDANQTLWRRVIMPANYANASVRCGNAPWQIPTCISGYVAASLPFCKSNDEKLVSGVAPADFDFEYLPSASSTTPSTEATNPANSDTARNNALQTTQTLSVTITSHQVVAGRDISRSGSLRTTRLDSNATAIAKDSSPTAVPDAPNVSTTVSDGHNLVVTWPRVQTATSYGVDYRINAGAWVAGASNLDNNSRSYTVTAGAHTDTVEVRVKATNSVGDSAYGTKSTTIPLWAPLVTKGSWTEYSIDYSSPAYTKTKAGVVLVKGLVKSSGSPSVNDVIGTLPPDYRPSGGRLMFGTTSGSNASARVDVSDNGDIHFMEGGAAGWYSLETIRFVPTGSYTRTALTLQNGFTNWAGGYASASYVQDSTGRVSIQGLLNNGTRTNGTVIATIPAALRPAQYQHHASRSGTFHHLGIDTASGLLAKGDGTGAYSINAMYLPNTYTSWTALPMTNGWNQYPGFTPPQYTKTSDGLVSLRGLIRPGTASYDDDVAILPAGFRPAKRILYTTVNTGGHSRLDIMPNGEVRYMSSGGSSWYSLDNVTFVAEQ